MTRRHLLTLLAALACGAGAVHAQTPDPDTEASPRHRTAYVGEITELEETSFRMRPWNPNLPNRVQVTANQGTRYFRQVKADRGDLKTGDLVLVVEDARRPVILRPKAHETSDEREAREAKQKEMRDKAAREPGKARAILRVWPAPEGRVSPQDEAAAQAMLVASRGHFNGRNQGSVPPPGKNDRRWVGVVKSVKPLTVTLFQPKEKESSEADEPDLKERVFEAYRESIWLDHVPAKPEDLKKGKTVMVQSVTPLASDGTLQALMIVQCVEPNRSPEKQRKLILRERKGRD